MEKVRNITEDKAKLSLNYPGSYTIDYGVLNKGEDSRVELVIEPDKEYIKLKAEASCGCTKPAITKNEDFYSLVLSYDTNRPGTFSKNVYLRHGKKEDRKVIIFNLKGVVG